MATDSSGFDIHYEAVDVRIMELNVMQAGAADPTLMGPVAVWNCGVTSTAWGTAKTVKVRGVSMTIRERCLHLSAKRLHF